MPYVEQLTVQLQMLWRAGLAVSQLLEARARLLSLGTDSAGQAGSGPNGMCQDRRHAVV